MAFIYKITNDINNKVYVGETAIGIEHRWLKHIQDLYKRNFKLQLAMRKYGIEHFQIEQIEECEFANRFEREKFWIAHYDSYYNGYNSTLGGEGATKYDYDEVYQLWLDGKTPQELSKITGASNGTIQNILRANSVGHKEIHNRIHAKPVIQFSKEGVFIQIFESASEAGRATGQTNGSNIIACCNGKLKSSSGYIWKYVEDETPIEDYLSTKKKRTTGKKVIQFDLNDNFLAEFPSCEAAARELGLSSGTPINRCARGERKTAYGFKWKYVGDNNYLAPIKSIQNKRQVAQYSREGQLIQIYNSITEAARATGQKSSSNISQVCKGKAQTAGGYIWRYYEESNQ